ncbi:TRAP transporter substrate-binding protein [Acuticoccus sp. 2012]|uniref:TRAP transporter substrate-binding protein n=2 Tax=Acuticoccus mangrovi TaxID=2796142 RepID=A0A934MHH3_9HYPH|nr:TRAP transporter substrate-binding protein [Acuticoccus mangrovi]
MQKVISFVGLVAGASMLVTAANAADYTIRFHISTGPDQPATLAAERFAEAVEKRSDGRIDVNVYPSEQLGGEPDAMQNVRIGGIQLAFMSPGAIGNLLPDFLILNGPFLWEDWDTAKAVLNGPFGEEMFEKLRTQTGIRVLDPLWYWGWREMTADRPIRTVADLDGLKMRSPNIPIFVEMFRSLGANPTTVNFQEIYSALQQGVVDGEENPIPAIWSQRFYEVNPFISMTNHILQTNIIIANDMFFQSLPDDLKTIVQEEIVAAGKYNTELQMEAETALVEKIEAAGGTFVEDVDRAAFREATTTVYDSLADSWSDGLYARIQDAIAAAQAD